MPPYLCEICGKSVKQRNGLVRHLRTHNGEHPYECDLCGHRFTEAGNLRRHYRNIHRGLRKFTNEVPVTTGPPIEHALSVYAPKPFQAASRSVIRPVTRPPKKELQGQKKWVVENFENHPNIVIDQTAIKQIESVYIYNCKECTIIIKGQVNTIILDSCKKTAVVLDDLVANLEFVNCQSVQSQINGEVKLISIDKTVGIQVYISDKSKEAEIVTWRSSGMNVLIPTPEGDFSEYALPEQGQVSSE